MSTHLTNSLDKKQTIPEIEAPSTLRIPISFVFCSAVNEVNPNKPRQAMHIAIREKPIKL